MCGVDICLFFGQVRLIPKELHQVRLKPFAFGFTSTSLSRPTKETGKKAPVGFGLNLRSARVLSEVGGINLKSQ